MFIDVMSRDPNSLAVFWRPGSGSGSSCRW